MVNEFGVNIQIRGEGGKTINQMLAGFDNKTINKIGTEIIKDLAKKTQTSMVLRAPRSTEALKHSIVVYPRGTNSLVVSAGQGLERPYAACQGLGFEPHYVSMFKPEIQEWIMLHGMKMVSYGEHRGKGGKKGMIYVRRFKPFFLETINYYLTPQLISQVANQHIQQALSRRNT